MSFQSAPPTGPSLNESTIPASSSTQELRYYTPIITTRLSVYNTNSTPKDPTPVDNMPLDLQYTLILATYALDKKTYQKRYTAHDIALGLRQSFPTANFNEDQVQQAHEYLKRTRNRHDEILDPYKFMTDEQLYVNPPWASRLLNNTRVELLQRFEATLAREKAKEEPGCDGGLEASSDATSTATDSREDLKHGSLWNDMFGRASH